MIAEKPSRRPFFEQGAEQSKWTPRAVAVLATAKALASSGRRICGADLLLALECGDHEVSRVLRQLGISPSTVLGRAAPAVWSYNTELYWEDFDCSLSEFPKLVLAEAVAMDDRYLGIEHLLLFLARIGVSGIDLPYDRIKKTWLEIMDRS